jgi:uncharacterized protein (TIRG00374 family)
MLVYGVKLAVALALIIWMVRSGRLNLSPIEHVPSEWPRMALIAAIFYAQIFLMAWRWRLLSGALGICMSIGQAFSLTMIGMLFNTALPGAVGGDLIKAYYAGNRRSNRTASFASILTDRIIGLFSLVTIAVCGATWKVHTLLSNKNLRSFWLMLVAALVAAAGGFMIALLSSRQISDAIGRFGGPLPFRGIISDFLRAFAAYNRSRTSLLSAFALSIPCHLMACAAYYFAFGAVSPIHLPVSTLLVIVPLGFVTTAVPLAPGGIGVGQVAFYGLFQYLFNSRGSLGSGAFTFFQLVLILVNLSGSAFYLRISRAVPDQTAVATAD